MSDSKRPARKGLMFRFLDWVEWGGNKLPHPFWLFCYLILGVLLLSASCPGSGWWRTRRRRRSCRPSTRGRRIDGQDLRGWTRVRSRSHRDGAGLVQLAAEEHPRRGVHGRQPGRSSRRSSATALRSFEVSREAFPVARRRQQLPDQVRQPLDEEVRPRSLLSREGINWFVLHMVENFAHFEPLGLVLVMLMGVAIAEGSGLIPTIMRGIAISVPKRLITPALFALAACGNVGSDAGIVVIPPLAAAIFRQLGRNPIVGLLVGYVGATAGFTANLLPAGTDVLAMSLTNAATGNNPEINVLANWYFMSASVLFLAVLGTFVTNRYVAPRIGGGQRGSAEIEALSRGEEAGHRLGAGGDHRRGRRSGC